jgi:MoxR-like ATPase
MDQGIAALNEQIKRESEFIRQLTAEVGKVIVGQKYLLERLLVGLLADGHILLEGVPGLAKTLSVKTLSTAIQTNFHRIQFTPDLLPADVVGTLIYNPKDGEFRIKKGPVFANLILADEINRAPAKVQSALLEAMQERQVTIGDQTFPLPEPFLVLATQNPIEQEGTYPLPEAQVDRFMLKLSIGYPTKDEERQIMERMAATAKAPTVTPVITPAQILQARRVVDSVYMDEKIKNYIVDLVFATRDPQSYQIDLAGLIQYGASPRATIYLALAAKAYAFLQGRGYVTPQDVKTIGLDVLRHRVILSYEAEAEDLTSEKIIKRIFDEVPVP